MTTQCRPSPAAVAAVIQALRRAHIQRSTELKPRVFSPGYDATLRPDHVQVSWTTWGDEYSEERERRDQLARCEQALTAYDVTHARAKVSVPGGWEDQQVLEVRSERWGR